MCVLMPVEVTHSLWRFHRHRKHLASTRKGMWHFVILWHVETFHDVRKLLTANCQSKRKVASFVVMRSRFLSSLEKFSLGLGLDFLESFRPGKKNTKIQNLTFKFGPRRSISQYRILSALDSEEEHDTQIIWRPNSKKSAIGGREKKRRRKMQSKTDFPRLALHGRQASYFPLWECGKLRPTQFDAFGGQ